MTTRLVRHGNLPHGVGKHIVDKHGVDMRKAAQHQVYGVWAAFLLPTICCLREF
ncbi:hypothetical protein QPX08_01800 [Corynebacterium propinquum]|uniref:hypothetical protein n=1 Tax=Corynebacterium propinquum TaxID=43769 RepID=UPI002542D7EC|nr:hypothetical protein [Corynebacterium propinquum]MDK4238261.1 hypothetical protein [Corynebacterium propinquum]